MSLSRSQMMFTRAPWLGTTMILVWLCCTVAQDKPSIDQYGDPLPPGAMARLGTMRLRHESGITCQALSPDGQWLATGGGRTVRLWSLAAKQQTQVFTLQNGNRSITPSALAFSPDSRFLGAASSYGAGAVFVWNLQSGQLRYQVNIGPREESGLPNNGELPFLAILAGGQQVLVRNYGEGFVRQFDLETGQELRSFADKQNALTSVAITPDGTLLAAGSNGRQVILWNVQTGQEQIRLPHAYPLVSVAFSADGRTLATLDQDLAPILWDVKTGKEKLRLPGRTRSVGVSFGPRDESLIVARQPDQLIIWNLTAQKEKTITLPRGWVTSAVSPLFLTSSPSPQPSPPREVGNADEVLLNVIPRRNNSAKVRLVKLNDQQAEARFDGYENGSVFPFYLSKLAQWASIATEADDHVRLWDAQGRIKSAYELPIHEAPLRSYAIAPDGSSFVLGCGDGRVLVVDGNTGKTLHEIGAFSKSCFDSEISSDGQDIIATDLRNVKVYDLHSGKLRTSYEIRDKYVYRAMISGDGSRLAAQVYQDDDQPLLRLYEARTGKVLQETRPTLNTTSYFLSGDGRSLIYLANRGGRTAGITVLECATGKVRQNCDLPSSFPYVGMHARISPDGRWLFATASGTEADQYAAIGWRLGSKDDPVVFTGHRGALTWVNYSADSKQLLSLSSDSTMLIWDLSRYQPPTAAPTDEKALHALWQQLADRDAVRAYHAIQELAQHGGTALPGPNDTQGQQRNGQSSGTREAWIMSQINAQFKAAEPEQVQELIDRLDAAKFEDRERATQRLIRMGSTVLPLIRTALENAGSAEAKRRLQRILDQGQESSGLGGLELQLSRAVETLEIMGTPAALMELRKLAGQHSPIGGEARLAALRLGNRLAATQSSAAAGESRSGR